MNAIAYATLIFICFFSSPLRAEKLLHKLPKKKIQEVSRAVKSPQMQETEQGKETLHPVRVKRATINKNSVVRFTYTNHSWNKDSAKIETGSLYLVDSQSKQVVQLVLQETDPDSSTFGGLYVISWGNVETFSPELYATKMIGNSKAFHPSLQSQIQKGTVIRKPFALTRDDRGIQNIQIFDTKEQVEQALSQSEQQQETVKAREQPVPTAAKAVLEAEKIAELAREKKRLEAEARTRELERQKLEDLERKRAEERIKQQQQLAESEKRKRRQDAVAFAEAAMDFYRVGQFKEAEAKFEKSVELDPENRGYYYQYGVTLYRNENFNKSLVYLRLADGATFDKVERDFYVGLNHYRLKEYVPAVAIFKKVEATNHDPLGPSAAFYQGLVNFADTKYETAKEDFQRVLDTSKDPRLDDQAEEYMDKIDRILFFAKNKNKPFLITANFGPQYDSNVLLVSDETASKGTGASSQGSIRYNMGGSLHYRPIYESSVELGAKAKTDYTYTVKDELNDYDTWTMTFTLPLVYKGLVFGKGIKSELAPGYERLYLGQDTGGQPKESQNSTIADSSTSLVMNENWFLALNLKYRNDVYVSTPDSDATKITYGLGNSLFFNKQKTKAFLFDIAQTANNAKGNSAIYSKTDLSAIYLTSLFWELQLIGGISYYTQTYSFQDPVRKDANTSYSITLARPITDWLKAMLNGAYISNDSNIDANKYKKSIVGLNIMAEKQF